MTRGISTEDTENDEDNPENKLDEAGRLMIGTLGRVATIQVRHHENHDRVNTAHQVDCKNKVVRKRELDCIFLQVTKVL